LIAYFIGNISAKKKYQNPFTCITVVASQRWDVFETRCRVNRWSHVIRTKRRCVICNFISPSQHGCIAV